MNWRAQLPILTISLWLTACGSDNKKDNNEQGNETLDPALVYTLFESDEGRKENPTIDEMEFAQWSTDNNRFALKLFRRHFNVDDDNSAFSPFSISSALAMTYVGAAGNTKAEVAQALEFNLPEETLHAGFNRSLTELEQRNRAASATHPALELLINNALWPSLDGEPAKHYLDSIASHYGAGIYALNYSQEPDRSREAINTQIEQWTNGYIVDLLSADAISPATRMVITSSIYLFAPWLNSFSESSTQPRPFNNLDGATVETPIMRSTSQISYGQTDDAEFGSLPFRDGDLQMLFIIPNEDFVSYVEDFDVTRLTAGIEQMQINTGVIEIPKFKVESDVKLSSHLQALGMQEAFTTQADFSQMGMGSLYIDEVKHKAVIEVNEAGTTAAAATAVLILPPSIPPTVLTINSPFIYVIYDRPTNTILFMGHIANF